MGESPATLRLLGPVSVSPNRLSNRRAVRLLAVLALERGPHHAHDLVKLLVDHNALPGDRPSRDLLHRSASDARTALGDAASLLTYNRGLECYELRRDPALLTIDVDEAAAFAAAGAWQEALDRHRGPVAQGLDELWLDKKRSEQRQSLTLLIEKLFPGLDDVGVAAFVNATLAGQHLPTTAPSEIGSRVALLFARDIHRAYELDGDAVVGREAQITGIITRRGKTKDRVFLDITDSQAQTLQVVVRENSPAWSAAVSAKLRDKVLARGVITIMRPQHSTEAIVSIAADTLTQRNVEPERVSTLSPAPHTGTYLARLANHFRARLADDGFVEVATKIISTHWPADSLEVLHVVFDGYGPDHFFLSPSPVQQLIDVIIESPFQRAFSVGHCITPTYRDPHVSTESAIVGAVALQLGVQHLSMRSRVARRAMIKLAALLLLQDDLLSARTRHPLPKFGARLMTPSNPHRIYDDQH